MDLLKDLMQVFDKAAEKYKVPVIPDMDLIFDGDNVPSEEGDQFKQFEKEKFGGPAPRIEPNKFFAMFDPASFKRNKEFFMTDREKEANEDEYLKEHGINF